MKIVRLDLLAFGPFTNVSLTLDAGHEGVHIIYGPNEAGKTSALRALRQLLYGIPHTSEDDFIHSHQDLRIGAVLRRASGELLECIRRKGRVNTLRGADDATILDPSCLANVLGGVDETAFELQFGIDNESLQRGGRAIVEGGGDLAQLLFAAGAGVADLGSVQERLVQEADELFKPRGQNQRINKALADLGQASRELKAVMLPSSEWAEHEEALRASEARARNIQEQIATEIAQRERLERIQKALPLLTRRKNLREELLEVSSAPILSSDFAETRRRVDSELRAAEKISAELEQRITEVDARIAELQVPGDLLLHGPAIEQLFADLGAHRKAASDRPGLLKQRQQLETEILRLLRELGREDTLAVIPQLRVNPAQRLRIQTLGNQQQKLEAVHSGCIQTIERVKQETNEAQAALDELPQPRETAALARVLQRVRGHGNLDERLAAVQDELRGLEQQCAAALARLGLWSGTLADLESLPVPVQETIDRFDAELEEAAREVTALEDRVGEYRAKLQIAQENLEQLRRHQDVPTEEDLHGVRQRRDEGWHLVKQAWLSGNCPAETEQRFVALFSGSENLAEAFENSVERADEIADRLRREATRVAQKAKFTSDVETLAGRLVETQNSQKEAEKKLGGLQQEWAKQWQASGIQPLSPREMRAWMSKHARLIAAAEEVRKKRREFETLEEAAATCRRELCSELQVIGFDTTETTERLIGALVQQCTAVVTESERHAAARAQQQAELKRLGGRLSQATAEAREADKSLQEWCAHWGAAVRYLGLAADTTALEAQRILETVDDIVKKNDEKESLTGRLDGIDRNAAEFEGRVRSVMAVLTSRLDDGSVEQTVVDLQARLSAAQRVQTQVTELTGQRKRDDAKLNENRANLIRLKAGLDTMCEEAGCQSVDQLPIVEQQSLRRQELERELRQVEDRLLELAANRPLEAFIEEATNADYSQLASAIFQLNDELCRLESERAALLEKIGGEKTRLRQMDGSGRAARLREECEALGAQIRRDARDFARFRLASAILQSAMERYREKNQGPMLRRASELFEELTLGSFEGLRAECHDDQVLLVGVRNDGGRRETVFVSGMSDGTRDQLYLALRLAALEQFLDNREPMPFIVDDVLIKFDNVRAAAALKALGGISARAQVILFTHHDHLVRLAEDVLEEGRLFVHDLTEKSSLPPQTPAPAAYE